MKIVLPVLIGLMVLGSAIQAKARALKPAEECLIVAQLALKFRYETVDPFLGRDNLSRRKEGAEAVEILDCKAVFAENGLNTMAQQCSQNDMCYPFRARFGRLRLDQNKPDTAVIDVDEYSEGAFAEGRRLRLVRVGGIWLVESNEGTWIS